MKKQLIGVGTVAVLSLLLTACGEKTSVKSGYHTIYQTKVTSVKSNDNGDWIVKGTTSAPDGTKIMAVSTTSDDPDNASSTSDIDVWSKAKDGKFKTHVDVISATDYTTYKTGKKSKVAIFGITKYDQATDDSVPPKIISAFKKQFTPTTLKLTSKQVEYVNGLDDADSSDESSSSSSNNSYSKNVDSVVTFESEMNEAIEDSKGTIVDINYSANDDGSAINSVTIVASDTIELAPSKDQQKVADSALNTVTELSSANNIDTPSVSIVSESGTQIATSNSDKTAMTLSSD